MKPITPELRERLCSFIRAGATRVSAARSVGLTIEELREACDADQVFAAELEQAETDAVVATEIQLRQRDPRAWLRAQAAANPAVAKRAAAVLPKEEKKRGKGLHLTFRQLRFAEEYVKDHNGTKAAIRAGYSPKSAISTASALLTNPKVWAIIQQHEGRMLRTIEVSTHRTLLEVAALAFYNPADFFDANGDFIPLAKLSPIQQRAIAGMELEEMYDRDGRPVGRLRKIRFVGKAPYLTNLMKHLALLVERPPESDGRFTIEQIRQVLTAWDERDSERRQEKQAEALQIEDNSEAIDLEAFRNRGKK